MRDRDPAGHGAGERADDARRTAAARLALRFGLLVTAGLVALSLPLPWRVGGLVFLLLGLVTGVLALRASARASTGAGPVVVLSLGLVVTALVLGAQLLLLALWPISTDLDRCRASALTDRGARACQAEFERDLQGLLPGR